MKRWRKVRSIGRACEGATAVEFAIVSTVFFMLFMGLIEYGLYMMAEVSLESAVTQGGRVGAVCSPNNGSGSGATKVNCIQAVEAEITAVASGGANNNTLLDSGKLYFTENTVAAGGTVEPDICFPKGVNFPPDKTAATCIGPPPLTYLDGNNNGVYDAPGANSVGGTGDLVEIRATYPWHVFFPIFSQFFGTQGTILLSSSTVVKNE